MDFTLQTPVPPVNMLSGHVSESEMTFTVHCHDDYFRNVTASDSVGKPLFRVEGAKFGTSWSWRRRVWESSSDRHLFDFRHNSFDIKNGWVVESPDSRKLCSLVHKSQVTRHHSCINATVCTEAGEQVLVAMRHKDHEALVTTITVGDTTIATIHKINDISSIKYNPAIGLAKRSESERVWEVRVASGVDLSFIMALALCRVEMGHVWKQ
ncbi:hypothetical protein F5Y02DRAFT_91690 [Annulohypoxylon stygium]|nr:hypothetical protein F5Y02DRAFT_91690 [Annulohypoxylon stygium]